MATLKCSNVSKYDNGGSGDNYIADGFIKTVQKVWMDSYTIGTTTIASNDSICIGKVPSGKKLTGITIYTPVLMAAASNTTLFLDTGATMIMTAANTYLGTAQADGVAWGTDTADTAVAKTWRLKGDKIGQDMPKDVDIYMKLVVSGGVATAITGGTIRTIITYT
jgi:hypothetical protein